MKLPKRLLILVPVLLVAAVTAGLLLYSPASNARSAVTWSVPSLNQSLSAGEATTTIVSFTASVRARNVAVQVAPEIASYVSVSPSSFASITRGEEYEVAVTFTAPADAAVGVTDGTIQLRQGRRTLEPLLPVRVEVAAAIPQYEPGIVHQVTSQTVGVLGQTINIQGTNTPLDGIQVIIPPGALPADVLVQIGYDDGNLVPRSGYFPGVVLSLETDPITTFSFPVTIIVPFSGGASVVPVPYYINDDGELRPSQILYVDRSSNTFAFQTFHASFFSWILGVNVAYAPDLDDIIDTDFEPSDDGFQVKNKSSFYNREGECLGMTSFALWYYMNWETSRGGFYPEYYDVIGTGANNNDLRGQDIIATRAFTSITQQWSVYIPLVAAQQDLSEADRYSSIRNILLNTGDPVLIYLYHTDGSAGAHSVLAYALNDLDGDISIYDPNYPGDVRTIHYDTDTNTFDEYTGWFGLLYSYDGIVYNGDGSLNLAEPYQNILDDADADFQGSGNATIEITSHNSGDEVFSRDVTIRGTIESGEVLITTLDVLVGSTPFTTNVGLDGQFEIPVQLEEDLNYLVFNTIGNDSESNEISVVNNTTTTEFTLRSSVPRSIMLMTLTWDTNDTDLDAYVIDPTGDYSAYYHMVTADGGELDRDDVDGFGPEHWTLETSDVIRYGEPYAFRVHYYSDHGNGPTNYTVTIKLYEGTEREISYSYRGNLAVSDPENNAPDDQGPDWADIALITLTESNETQARSAGLLTVSPRIENNSREGIILTAPVPLSQERRK